MKTSVYIATQGAERRISWYVGTSDAQVEKAIRLQLHLPLTTQFLLRDSDGEVVPVSSTLPTDQHFTVVPQGDMVTSAASNGATIMTHTTESVDEGDEQAEVKRRRTGMETTSNTEYEKTRPHARVIITPRRRSDGPALATTITQFVNAFTRPIANDDNVGFIPNTGRFALDALYNELVEDSRCHPRGRDIFYKMTSLYGKVDRQRVLRYYRCETENGENLVVRSKPEGKGSLLRRYRRVTSAELMETAMKSEPFVVALGLDSKDVASRYMRFVHSFTPISRSEYQAHCGANEDAERHR